MAKTRKLGGSGLEVAPLALGGNVFGWTIDEQTWFRVLDATTMAHPHSRIGSRRDPPTVIPWTWTATVIWTW